MNNRISKYGFLCSFFLLSETMFFGLGTSDILNKANTSSIINIIISFFIGFLFLLLGKIFFNYKKDENIFKKFEILFGKKIGLIFSFISTIPIILFYLYILYNLKEFIQSNYLNETPSFLIVLLFLIPIILCNNNIKTILKVNTSLFITIFLIIIFTFFDLLLKIDIDNLKPFYNIKTGNLFLNSIIYLSYIFGPLFLLLVIPKNQIEDNNELNKNITIIYLISNISIILLFIFIIGIMGIDLSKNIIYPEFSLLKKINIFSFIEHIENILSIRWIYCIFASSLLSLYYVKEFFNHINLKIKYYNLIIVILSIVLVDKLFSNTTISYNFVSKYYHLIYSIPLFLILLISNIKIKISN